MRVGPITFFAALGLLTSLEQARADGVAGAGAEALFADAKRLMAEGKYAAACPKLVESQKLDPAVGTELNLAHCLKENGQLASAWTTFLSAASSARSAGQVERGEYARKEAAALEPLLGRLVVIADDKAPAKLSINVDGTALPQGLWSSGLPLDAGEHRVEVSASGYQTVTRTVVTKDGASTSFAIPALAPKPAGAAQGEPAATNEPTTNARPAASATEDTGVSSSQRIAAVATGGLGLVCLGVGGFFGLSAQGKFSDSSPECNDENVCTPKGKELRDSAQTSATVATVATGVGIGALAAAAVLWFTSGSEKPHAAALGGLRPSLDARGVFSIEGDL